MTVKKQEVMSELKGLNNLDNNLGGGGGGDWLLKKKNFVGFFGS
jgi:hypothetical protein